MKADIIAARRNSVAQLLLAGYSVRAIAADLSVPKSTVHRDIEALRGEWSQHRVAAVEGQVSEDLQRFAAIERTLWSKALVGDHVAIATWLRLQERRAALLGLNGAARVDLRLDVLLRQEVEAIAAKERLPLEVVMEELDAILSGGR